MGSSPQLAGQWYSAFGQYAPASFWQNKSAATAPSSSSNLGRRVRFPVYPRNAQQLAAPGSFANMTSAPHLQAPDLLAPPPLPSIDRSVITPSTHTPPYTSGPRTERQQQLLNAPIYEAGPNLNQEGRDVAARWGINLEEKPEGWKFRPISYQEFYGKPTPTEMLGGDLGAKFSADISGGSDPGYQSYMSALDEYDKKWNELYGSATSSMYAPRVNYFGYLKGLKEGTTWAAPELKPPPTDPNEGNPLRKVPLETLLSNYVVSGREPGGLVADAIDWWKKQGKT